MILVRLLLFFALAAVVVAALLFLFTGDRQYLRFIVQVAKFTLLLAVVVLVGFFVERLAAPLL